MTLNLHEDGMVLCKQGGDLSDGSLYACHHFS